MTEEASSDSLEEKLLYQLSDIEGRIRDLISEKEALQRLIAKVRRESAAARDTTRKNSLDRIVVENKILNVLREAKEPIPAKFLLQEARVVNYMLKDSTFRSYLHRLKERGLIIPSGQRGYWLASDTTTHHSEGQ